MGAVNARETSVVILGGGPGGYEAALVGAHLGARVTVVDRDGLGGAAVLTDCVPSKALISTADFMSQFETAADLGVHLEDNEGDEVSDSVAELAAVNRRVMRLAAAQSRDIGRRLEADGVRVLRGVGRLVSASRVRAELEDGGVEEIPADVVLVATGATPRVMATAQPDGERILTWQQIYGLQELPEKLVVVGSGVTGAELAQAYLGLGSEVDPGLLARPGSARRGRGCRHGDRGRLPQARDGGPQPLAHGRRRAHREGRAGPARGRPRGGGLARAAGRRLRAADQRSGPRGGRRPARGLGSRLGRPRLAHVGARGVCRGRLHRRASPCVRGGDAGTHRDGPRPRRRRDAAEPAGCVGQHLHRPRDRHRRLLAEGRRRGPGRRCRR